MFKKYNLLLVLIFGMFTVVSSANAETKDNENAQNDYNKCTAECQDKFPGQKNDELRYECVQKCGDELEKSLGASTESPAQDESQEAGAQ